MYMSCIYRCLQILDLTSAAQWQVFRKSLWQVWCEAVSYWSAYPQEIGGLATACR